MRITSIPGFYDSREPDQGRNSIVEGNGTEYRFHRKAFVVLGMAEEGGGGEGGA